MAAKRPTYTRVCPGCRKRYQIHSEKPAPERCPMCVLRGNQAAPLKSHFEVERKASDPLMDAMNDVLDKAEEILKAKSAEEVMWACPKCGCAYAITGSKQWDACPKCRAAATKAARHNCSDPALQARISWWRVPTVLIALLIWFVGANSKVGPAGLICYPAICAIWLTVISWFARERHKRIVWYCGSALMVCSLVLWGRVDTFELTWWKEDARVTDRYARWTGRLVYRKVASFPDRKPGLPDWTTEGPISATGKRHGEWLFTTFQPRYNAVTEFYWYGEQITEGEWHLRSRE